MPQNAFAPAPQNAMLRAYEPTWKEQIAAYLMGNARPSPERRQFATGISDILGYLPGVGNVLQGQEAARAGDTKGTIMAMLPIPGANVAARAEQEIARDVAKGIRAYHGSPHSFERFDMSKIGTGEGAQAYGHGLYFAEHEPVAEGYRETLSPFGRGTEPEDIAARVLQATKGDQDAALEELRRRTNEAMARREPYEGVQKLMQARNVVNTNPGVAGHMYEVNIKADPEHFIDWDRPINEQSTAVKNAVRNLPYGQEDWVLSSSDPMLALEDARSAWMQKSGMDTRGPQNHRAAVTKDLASAGLPGVKYLDRGSRAAGEGSRNYVVFDDKIVEIMRKYGLMGPIGAGIAAKILERQQQRQEM
jgi:hypothetical protein